MKRMIIKFYRQASNGELPLSNTWWAQKLLDFVHMAVIVAQQTARDRLPVRAATLSYWTAVGAVPLLVLAFALSGPLGFQEATIDSVRTLIYDTFLSDAVGPDITTTIDELLAQIDLGAVGLAGMVGLMFIASQLYFQVELAFNDIFATRLHRSWVKRFVLFNVSIIVGPVFIAGGMVLSSILPEGASTFDVIVPWLLTSLAFVMAIKYLPNTPVQWRSAIIGGLISAAAFEGAKSGFGLYLDFVGTRDSMTRLYGSVAFLPVFLIWLNILWIVVLLGVELSYLMEKSNQLLDVQRERAADPHASRRKPDGLFAVGILLAVYQSTGDEPASYYAIADTAGVPVHHTKDTLEVLKDAGIVSNDDLTHWQAVHPANAITVGDVLRAWQGLAVPRWIRGVPSGKMVSQIQLKLEISANQSLEELIEEMEV